MTDGYNEKSCSALEKVYYKPIEAALRWCELIQHEEAILRETGNKLSPGIGIFPKWPCLRANAEKIYEATLCKELPCGRDGRTVAPGEHVAPGKLTVRHGDLKVWITKHYPDQKPRFLFDEVERSTHAAINADAFIALQAARDAQAVAIEKAKVRTNEIIKERDILLGERNALKVMVEKKMTATERNTLLTIISALCSHSGINHDDRSAARKIMEMTEKIGAPITDETIHNTVLLKISNAVEARIK